MPSVHVTSEVGPLRAVLVHTPGRELAAVTPANRAAYLYDDVVNLDLAHPYYAPAETNVDAWVSYQRKLYRDRINWKVQLNVRNLYRDSTPIAIGVQPWGSVSTVRLAPERRWYLTNTFSF